MRIIGKVWKFGNHIDTDIIIPARYLNTSDPNELALHCMEDYVRDFVKKISPGDIIIAGDNFGCGSSREHAPIAIKEAGISCVIASSFARIFFRNAINIGLPIFESSEASLGVLQGDELEVFPEKGIIKNITQNKLFKTNPMPVFIQNIIASGGLVEYTKIEIERR